ncbi:hypothetical protein L0B53_04045 [Vibrio sp. SS-MA-C1-2]|uniref:hypothetical protein n=1 Tax=Vibrio sp. SS-MA-C1-2 TaxID=2908646 RepID=UPI001F2D8983|nr:hypothetical protein [Vibrio sp. SS-MA-C1-2]UJF17097.1 hypothetical protein L0B53_04045 [Vibrio sp. SS-MA-C1-2]
MVDGLEPQSIFLMVEFLQSIQTPPHCRGLGPVLNALLRLEESYPDLFKQTFDLENTLLHQFCELIVNNTMADTETFKNTAYQKNWCERRYLYVILLKYHECESKRGVELHTLLFFKHFRKHEEFLLEKDKALSAATSFRLLSSYADFNFPVVTLFNNTYQISDTYKEKYQSLKDSENFASRVSAIANFYKLEWGTRRFARRNFDFRMSFNKVGSEEQLIGAPDNSMALLLKLKKSKKKGIPGDFLPEEAYPPLMNVRLPLDEKEKPSHILPDASILYDDRIKSSKVLNISRSIGKSHNLTLLNKNILQPHELFIFLNWCEEHKTNKNKIKGIPRHELIAFLMLTLWTGKALIDLQYLTIINDQYADGNGVFKLNEHYYFKFQLKKTVIKDKILKSDMLNSSSHVAITQVPIFLVSFLHLNSKNINDRLLAISEDKLTLTAINQLLKNFSKKSYFQLSLKRITRFTQNYLHASNLCNPVIFDFAFSKMSYLTRAPRHYQHYTYAELQDGIFGFWKKVYSHVKSMINNFDEPLLGEQWPLDGSVGSFYVLKTDKLQSLVNELLLKLKRSISLYQSGDIQALIQYHNDYVLYITHFIQSCTGYRAVNHPLPFFNFHFYAYSGMCISDKDTIDFSHTRVIAIPSALNQQLEEYKKHLIKLGLAFSLINEPIATHAITTTNVLVRSVREKSSDRINKIMKYKEAKMKEVGPLFYIEYQAGKFKSLNVTTSWLMSKFYTGEDFIPSNYARHFLANYLEEHGVRNELVYFQLGHWSVGEMPLSIESTLGTSDAIKEITPVLDYLVNELGWEVCPSKL